MALLCDLLKCLRIRATSIDSGVLALTAGAFRRGIWCLRAAASFMVASTFDAFKGRGTNGRIMT
jgi:hypothetical protein